MSKIKKGSPENAMGQKMKVGQSQTKLDWHRPADNGEVATIDRARTLSAEGLSLREIGQVLTCEGRYPKRGRWIPLPLQGCSLANAPTTR